MIKGKNILLCITGSIAAYKAPYLVRNFIKIGAQVKVTASYNGKKFISSITMEALSQNKFVDEDNSSAMEHINLARWADIVVIAPATANMIAKLAYGVAADHISTTCLASTAPIFVAPAMNKIMWENQATQNNIKILRERGITVLGPNFGIQACGDIGYGTMLEPEEIVDAITSNAKFASILGGKKILIASGPTQEPIDPVRFISNHSSGKMGNALAKAAINYGADVSFISGPVNIYPDNCKLIKVQTALEMYQAALNNIEDHDIFISCAAIADYRPKVVSDHKIKKSTSFNHIELIKNPDVLSELAKKFPKKFIVGFAAETQNLEKNAMKKLEEKKLDMVIANMVGKNLAFESDYNSVVIMSAKGKSIKIEEKTKDFIANKILNYISNLYFN